MRPPPSLTPGPDETLDRLSSTLQILQRRRGHRATSDDVLLAAHAARACPTARRILDLGTGKGTVALLLARRLPAARIVGVEAFARSHALAERNAALNGLADRYRPLLGDVRDPQVLAGEAPFDLVCGAPPFMPVGTGVLPTDPQRAAGRFELRGGVEGYAACAFAHLAPAGRVVLLLDGLQKERLIAACGKGLRRLVGVSPRPAAPPTFWIGIAAAEPASTPIVEDHLAMRLEAAHDAPWSPAYAALRVELQLDRPGR